jgi:ketosteroid isomerase-like protein
MNRIVLALCSTVLLASQAPPATAEIEDTLKEFIAALNDVDWPAFRKCWTDNPVVFHSTMAHRIDDPKVFDESWQVTFENIKKQAVARGATQPPYINLQPRDLRIDVVSQEVAIATFHLESGGTVGRRTAVFLKTSAGWKIAHFHASNIAAPKAQ